jgi:hypothetical protein
MSRDRLALLQWFGLLAAPLAWTTQLVLGFGVTQAACGAGGRVWRISITPWEIGLTVGAGVFALAAQGCAATLFRRLRGVRADDPGPPGRLYFFSIAALFGNTLFLVAIALTGIDAAVHAGCHQS